MSVRFGYHSKMQLSCLETVDQIHTCLPQAVPVDACHNSDDECIHQSWIIVFGEAD